MMVSGRGCIGDSYTMKTPKIIPAEKSQGNPKNGWKAVIGVGAVLLGVLINGIRQDMADEKTKKKEGQDYISN